MTVLVVDDDPSVRSILRSIIENRGNEVIGEAADGEQAIEASERLRPDLVLLDVSMPVKSGFPAARYLHEKFPDLSFMFVSQHRDQSYSAQGPVLCGYGLGLRREGIYRQECCCHGTPGGSPRLGSRGSLPIGGY